MTNLPVDLNGAVTMTSKPKPGPQRPVDEPEVIAASEGSEPVFEADADPVVTVGGRDRSVVRMSEGTRQDILQFGRVQDPNDPTRWLTAADIPQ